MTYEEAVNEIGLLCDFQRDGRKSRVYWTSPINPDSVGPALFSFDKKNVYYLFRDFPYALNRDEVQIFCEDEPYWANYFRDRLEEIGFYSYEL